MDKQIQYIYIQIDISYAPPPHPLVPRCCLISVIVSGNFAFVWPSLGTKEGGGATILQLRILDPRLLGDVQCDNLEFKIQDFKTIFSGSWNIESCVPFFVFAFKILGFNIQDSQKNIF